MKILRMEQGTPSWVEARLGIPTASCFDKILTKGGKLSAQASGYMHQLVAEWLLGCPLDDFASGYMQRGTALEQRAVKWYEFTNDCEVDRVGLCVRDDGGEPFDRPALGIVDPIAARMDSEQRATVTALPRLRIARCRRRSEHGRSPLERLSDEGEQAQVPIDLVTAGVDDGHGVEEAAPRR